jgi:hypothetical protein
MTMIDVSRPNSARVYSYLLGGKDHFSVDREAAERMLASDPGLRRRARLNRAFVTGATKRAIRAGITQFIDLGSGLPVHPWLHEVIHLGSPLARVAYVDSDPVAFAHTNACAAMDEAIVAALADIRDPAAVLADPAIRPAIDLSEPACVILAAVSHLLPPEQVAGITAGYMGAMAPGSWLVFSTEHITDAALCGELARLYGVDEFYNHCGEGIAAFFSGLDLVEPGIAEARRWLSGLGGIPAEPGQRGYTLCAAGIKPAAR